MNPVSSIGQSTKGRTGNEPMGSQATAPEAQSALPSFFTDMPNSRNCGPFANPFSLAQLEQSPASAETRSRKPSSPDLFCYLAAS